MLVSPFVSSAIILSPMAARPVFIAAAVVVLGWKKIPVVERNFAIDQALAMVAW